MMEIQVSIYIIVMVQMMELFPIMEIMDSQ